MTALPQPPLLKPRNQRLKSNSLALTQYLWYYQDYLGSLILLANS